MGQITQDKPPIYST